MLWKIYFWVYLILNAFGVIFIIPSMNILNLNAAAWSGLAESILALIGLYSYIYHKKILSAYFWKILFLLLSFIWLLQLIYSTNLLPNFLNSYLTIMEVNAGFGTDTLIGVIFGIILGLPALYAIYKLGFSKS